MAASSICSSVGRRSSSPVPYGLRHGRAIPAEVLELVDAEGVEFVDLRFCDLPGVMQHVSIPASVLDEGQFEDGHAFDGSSVRGFQQIQETDMVLIADPNTAYLDPFRRRKTLVMHCYVADPVTGERY